MVAADFLQFDWSIPTDIPFLMHSGSGSVPHCPSTLHLMLSLPSFHSNVESQLPTTDCTAYTVSARMLMFEFTMDLAGQAEIVWYGLVWIGSNTIVYRIAARIFSCAEIFARHNTC